MGMGHGTADGARAEIGFRGALDSKGKRKQAYAKKRGGNLRKICEITRRISDPGIVIHIFAQFRNLGTHITSQSSIRTNFLRTIMQFLI
jgi:hypothetical protein